MNEMPEIKNQRVLCMKSMDRWLEFLGAGMVGMYFLLQFYPRVSFFYSNIMQLVAPLICGGTYCYLSRYNQNAHRGSLQLIAAASFIWAVGQLTWMYYEIILDELSPYVNLPHIGYTLSYLLLGMGLFKRLSLQDLKKKNYEILINVAILLTVIVTILWYFEIGTFITRIGLPWYKFLILFSEPLFQLGLITLLVLYLYDYQSQINLYEYIYTLLGLVCLVIVDAKFIFKISTQTYRTGDILDLFWPLAFILFALAGIVQDKEQCIATFPPAVKRNIDFFLNIVPYIAILLIPVLFIMNSMRPKDPVSVEGMYVCSFLSVLWVALRQVFLLRERNGMISKLEDYADDLQEQIKRLKWMDDVSNGLVSFLGTNQLFETTIKQIRKMGICDYCWIGLYDPENYRIEAKAFSFSAGELFADIPAVILGESLTGKVGQLKRPIITNEPDVHPYFSNRLKVRLTGYLGVPLLVEKRLVGVLALYNTSLARKFSFEDLRFMLTLARPLAIAIDNNNLYKSIQSTNMNTLIAFAKVIESKSPYTRGHSQRVANLARKIGVYLNFDAEQVENLYQGALLHDIGKVGVEDRILNKRGFLTAEEYDVIKQHPALGIDIIQPIHQFNHIIPMIGAHHERNDGSGYPLGLKGEEIPLEAKIISVADVFDAITSNRPYRTAQSYAYALEEIERHTPAKFDNKIVEALKYILNREKKIDKTS